MNLVILDDDEDICCFHNVTGYTNTFKRTFLRMNTIDLIITILSGNTNAYV